MSDGLKDILSNLNKDTEQGKLLEYLNEHLSDAEKHAFEKQMSDDDFINDAVEGLQAVKNKEQIAEMVNQLNADLKKQVEKKKQRKQKRKLADQTMVYYAIILILLLVIAGYLVVKKLG